MTRRMRKESGLPGFFEGEREGDAVTEVRLEHGEVPRAHFALDAVELGAAEPVRHLVGELEAAGVGERQGLHHGVVPLRAPELQRRDQQVGEALPQRVVGFLPDGQPGERGEADGLAAVEHYRHPVDPLLAVGVQPDDDPAEQIPLVLENHVAFARPRARAVLAPVTRAGRLQVVAGKQPGQRAFARVVGEEGVDLVGGGRLAAQGAGFLLELLDPGAELVVLPPQPPLPQPAPSSAPATSSAAARAFFFVVIVKPEILAQTPPQNFLPGPRRPCCRMTLRVGRFGMRVLLYVLGGLLLIAVAAALYLYFRMRRYLAKSQQRVQGTASELIEEIDSYQEKTQ